MMPRKTRVLIVWEMGAGMGHLVPLKRIAEAMAARNMEIIGAHLCLLDNAAFLAPCVNGPIRQAPIFYQPERQNAEGPQKVATFGEFLADLGFASHERLARQLGLWRRIFEEERPDLILADHSPTAMLAARSLGIPLAAATEPYCLPPAHLAQFPSGIGRGATRRHDETQVLAAVNLALAEFGDLRLTALPQLLDADLTCVATLPILDFYHAQRVIPTLPPMIATAPPAKTAGEEVVVYLSTPGGADDPIWEGLASLDMPLLVLTRNIGAAVRQRLARPNITISAGLLTPPELAARARVLVSNGNHGTLCMGIRAGLPHVCLPLNGPQLSYSQGLAERRIAAVLDGPARTAAAVAGAIRQAYESQGALVRARTLAAEVAPMFLASAAETFVDQVEAMLEINADMNPAAPEPPPAGSAPATRLRVFRLTSNAPDLRPARAERAWMNATSQRYAYRCVPLSIANASGWELILPAGLEASWDGGEGKEAIQVTSLSGGALDPHVATSHFGHGVLTFHTGYLLRTDPGWGILCRGAPNEAKDGIAALDGLVETDWLPFPFTMNWRFTRPGAVRFERGEVFCFLMPVQHVALDSIEPELLHIDDDPELKAEYAAWTASRADFLARLQAGDAGTVQEAWQRFYLKGATATGQAAPKSHLAKRRLQPGRRVAPEREG